MTDLYEFQRQTVSRAEFPVDTQLVSDQQLCIFAALSGSNLYDYGHLTDPGGRLSSLLMSPFMSTR